MLDHPAEFRFGRWKLLSVDRRGGTGRTWDTCDLLSQCRDATEGEKTRARKQAATDSKSNPALGPAIDRLAMLLCR